MRGETSVLGREGQETIVVWFGLVCANRDWLPPCSFKACAGGSGLGLCLSGIFRPRGDRVGTFGPPELFGEGNVATCGTGLGLPGGPEGEKSSGPSPGAGLTEAAWLPSKSN